MIITPLRTGRDEPGAGLVVSPTDALREARMREATDLFDFYDMGSAGPTPPPSAPLPLLGAILQALRDPIVLSQAAAQQTAQERATAVAIEEYAGETRRLMGLGDAPLGVLLIGGGAVLALGASGTGGWSSLLRWIGGGTLVASSLIALRRALAGV